MKDYVTVPEALYRDTKALEEWLMRGYGYAATLAPKKPKPRGGQEKVTLERKRVPVRVVPEERQRPRNHSGTKPRHSP